jgi:hypothetical protein
MRRRDAILDVPNWESVPMAEQARIFDPKRKRRKTLTNINARGKNLIFRPNSVSISPVDLYVYLKARFGPPNDLMMVTRTTGTDNIIQWGYSLRSVSHHFMIHGTSSRVEFFERLSESDWRTLVDTIKQDFARYGQAMSNERRALTRWTLFINPFRRIQKTVYGLGDRLQMIHLNEPVPRPIVMTKAEADASAKELAIWTMATNSAATLGTCIRMLAPVMAEAFVNFVLFVLGRDDVRRDQRLYDSLLRQPIDVRVRSFHLNCDGFARPVDCEAEPFANFHSLMNQRNDLLHGNVDPHLLAFDEVWFDRYRDEQIIPLFRDDRSMTARFLANSLKFVEPDAAIGDVRVVSRFMEHVVSQLSDDVAERFIRRLEQDYLGWNPTTGELSDALFSDAIVENVLLSDTKRSRRSSRSRKKSGKQR